MKPRLVVAMISTLTARATSALIAGMLDSRRHSRFSQDTASHSGTYVGPFQPAA